MTAPSIACLGVIGKNNNPLHISIFPSYDPAAHKHASIRTPLQFSLMLSSSLDVFEVRGKEKTSGTGLSGDLGLLHAIDERISVWGYECNTGTKFVCIIDSRGRRIAAQADRPSSQGLREADLKSVWKAMHAAYIRLLQNPFYDPDEHTPIGGRGGKRIGSRRFAEDMRRIGENWGVPGGGI